MSSKLVKNGSSLHLLGDDEIILELKIARTGKMMLHAPHVHPRDVCKLLQGLVIDLMFSLNQQEQSSVVQPVTLDKV